MASRFVVEHIEASIADVPRRFTPQLIDAGVTLAKPPYSIV